MSEFRLPRLQRTIALVDKMGLPLMGFQRWWQSMAENLEAQEASQNTAIAEVTALIGAINAALPGYVLKAQTPAWVDPTGTLTRTTFAAYAGQTVSAGYVQAEAQATDNHVKVLSERLAALITDLRANGVLT